MCRLQKKNADNVDRYKVSLVVETDGTHGLYPNGPRTVLTALGSSKLKGQKVWSRLGNEGNGGILFR